MKNYCYPPGEPALANLRVISLRASALRSFLCADTVVKTWY